MTTSNRKKNNKANKRSKGAQIGSRIGLFFKVLLLVVLVCILILFLTFYLKYGRTILQLQQQAKEYVWSSTVEDFKQYQTSIFFDIKGEVISTLSGEREVYYVKYEDIPADIIDAMVTIEDKRYFQHEGVDFVANVRAAVALIQNKGKITQGASTITQQLARNIFLTNDITVERKVKEIFIASELEKKYTKQQILEFYLNNIYYANGYYGIQAAANGYFGKSISNLTLSEAAFLCAIPNSPSLYNPMTNIQNTYERRDRILSQMYEDGLISKKEYKAAIQEDFKLIEQTYGIHNYVETYVYQCTIEAFMKQEGFQFAYYFDSKESKEAYINNYQERYDYYQNLLYTGGYRVYTSIDLKQQSKLQDVLDRKLSPYEEKNEEGVYQLQGSSVCIDNETGRVVAIVGGRSQEFSTYTFNRAYQSYRQPGSAIKPLIVYTPYFERGHNPDELVLDEKREDGPKNSNGVYLGEISLRMAIEQSKNTIAWSIFEELTPSIGLSYLKRMNFKKLSNEDYVPAASLGGFTYGTNTLEMAAAYASLANDGYYRKPSCIIRITNSEGETICLETLIEEKVYKAEATYIMTNVLEGVLTQGTAKGLSLDKMPAAGKTGTTSDRKDGWFVGYTPYYTTAVWVGYDYPKAMSDLYGNTYPGAIWHEYMEQLHEGKETTEFTPYTDTWSLINEDGVREEDKKIEDEIQNEQDEMHLDEASEEDKLEEDNPQDEELYDEDIFLNDSLANPDLENE